MTSIETLRDLQRRVEAATGPAWEIDWAIGLAIGGWRSVTDQWGAAIIDADGNRFPDSAGALYTSVTESIDAAMALATRALPGCWWQVDSEGNATIGDPIQRVYGCPSPALALVTALLLALIAQAESSPSDLAANGETK